MQRNAETCAQGLGSIVLPTAGGPEAGCCSWPVHVAGAEKKRYACLVVNGTDRATLHYLARTIIQNRLISRLEDVDFRPLWRFLFARYSRLQAAQAKLHNNRCRCKLRARVLRCRSCIFHKLTAKHTAVFILASWQPLRV